MDSRPSQQKAGLNTCLILTRTLSNQANLKATLPKKYSTCCSSVAIFTSIHHFGRYSPTYDAAFLISSDAKALARPHTEVAQNSESM